MSGLPGADDDQRRAGEQGASSRDNDATGVQSSDTFRALVIDNVPDFVVLLDRQRRYVWVNRVAPGLSMSDVIGARLETYMSADTGPIARRVVERVFETGQPDQYEARGYADGQSEAWYLNRIVPVPTDGQITHVLLLTSDITKRKQAESALREAEERLHRAQRLESIGKLAGGIAHEFNNLLQVIGGTLSFVREGVREGDVMAEDLDEALAAIERAAELTSHLLAVGRRKHVSPTRVDLVQLVETSAGMLRSASGGEVSLIIERPPVPCFVQVDPPQLEEVLLNLFANAQDAMPDGGRIRVTINTDDSDSAVMSVSDDGAGIPEADLARIFDPFFSTKSSGSGMGLAVAAGIVSAHAGTITAESEEGKGTTMRVRLPIAPNEVPPVSPPRLPPKGSGVVLVAEDDASVRSQIVRMLEMAGYTALQAENGAEALTLFVEKANDISIVVLDVLMPVMDGWQTFLELEKIDPNVRVLFSTGYAAEALPPDFAMRGVRMLSKPYTASQLLNEIGQILGA
jgi:PAS domain S-box-containing protein